MREIADRTNCRIYEIDKLLSPERGRIGSNFTPFGDIDEEVVGAHDPMVTA